VMRPIIRHSSGWGIPVRPAVRRPTMAWPARTVHRREIDRAMVGDDDGPRGGHRGHARACHYISLFAYWELPPGRQQSGPELNV
jgi:hypothetical protein